MLRLTSTRTVLEGRWLWNPLHSCGLLQLRPKVRLWKRHARTIVRILVRPGHLGPAWRRLRRLPTRRARGTTVAATPTRARVGAWLAGGGSPTHTRGPAAAVKHTYTGTCMYRQRVAHRSQVGLRSVDRETRINSSNGRPAAPDMWSAAHAHADGVLGGWWWWWGGWPEPTMLAC